MEYGININFFSKTLGLSKAAEWIADAGFTVLDYTPPLANDSWESDLAEALAIFHTCGLTVHQTHAPFNRYGSHGDQYALHLERCAAATEICGAKFMVVHGDEFDFANHPFSPDAAFAYNHDLFLPYVNRAARNGYKIAFETVFEDAYRNTRRYTSLSSELLSLIQSYRSEAAVCCWDFGHANIAFGREAPDRVREFGTLIQCTHLHDNTGTDSHQMPMTGDINWQNTMRAFRDIGYGGTLCIEYAHGSMVPALCKDFIHLSYRSANALWNLTEES